MGYVDAGNKLLVKGVDSRTFGCCVVEAFAVMILKYFSNIILINIKLDASTTRFEVC